VLRHLADRIGARLRAKSLSGRTVTVRVRFADLRAVTRSITFDQPISTTAALAEIAEVLVRAVLRQYPHKPKISLLGIRISHLTKDSNLQLTLPLGLGDHRRGAERGVMRCAPDRAVDAIRERFGWEAIGYGSVVLDLERTVPDEFRLLAEKEL
jgi:DNA polymerase-4